MTIIGNNYIYNHTLSQEKLSLLREEPQSTLAEQNYVTGNLCVLNKKIKFKAGPSDELAYYLTV